MIYVLRYLFIRLFCYCICCNYRRLYIGTRCGKYIGLLPAAKRVFILENVGKIKKTLKNVKTVTRIKNIKKRFFYIYAIHTALPPLRHYISPTHLDLQDSN